ncbi:hypothetical protein BO71DRAFT_453540 [Aspergillus ellipticus CBS 707.79]|uniref:Tat pathway signal sequence n=1 Tax=Aspergillus ellipticus CBS 707.79 TaxID=1448320 RepID=A0A319DE05_9EURO|nr:hypothetical protein BO71DRAFT_453540 [Aspergillus ellipticus CBS 707.79]
MDSTSSSKYELLDDKDGDRLEDVPAYTQHYENVDISVHSSQQCNSWNFHRLLISANFAVFGISLILLSLAAGLLRSSGKNDLLRKTSEYSPIFDRLEIPLVTKKMNATLIEPDSLSIYRQPPSPKVDAAWKRLGNIKLIVISHPEDAAKWPETFGFGPHAYIGRIDVFHQIHCLDWLRREAYFDHYFGKKWPPGTTPANVDIYTHFLADAQLNAFPDFSVNHKCRDFDALLAWQEENSIDVDEFGAIRKPPEHVARVMSHRFKELFGWFESHLHDGPDSGEIA